MKLLFYSFIFNWRIIALQCCVGFCHSIIPSKEIPGLISFRMDWLDLLPY